MIFFNLSYIFFKEFQFMASAFDDNSLLSDHDANQFFVWPMIEP